MPRVNRAIELLEQDQPIFSSGAPALTSEAGIEAARTRADFFIIDFEHSRYDLAGRDLVRLATRVWANQPNLEDAFLYGYGPLTRLDRQIITHCSYLDTLTAAVRAAGRTP